MYLRASPNLQETIVTALSERSNLTAADLSTYSKDHLHACSIQAIYQELRQLQSRGVVVKVSDQYSLSLPWVLKMIQFTDHLERTYLRERSILIPLPEEGEEKVWHMSSLRRLEDFWVHLLLVLIEDSGSDIMFQWSPHPWYYLVQQKRQFDFQDSVQALGAKIYKIIGGRDFLSRVFASYHRKDLYTISTEKSPLESKRNIYLTIIGEYVLRIRFDDRTTSKVEEFFSKVKAESDLQVSDILHLFNRQAGISVRLKRDKKKVRTHLRDFAKVFKLDIKTLV